jgi:L-ascorbate metabolism protein UlaG (beta-lactamase superfamily)
VILSAATAGAAPLTARFIGNEGFELTDGKTVVLTDFPYDSGAFGYMTYGKDELRERKGSLCLITHAHADHFDAALAAKVGCRVLGPPSVLAKVPADRALSAGAGAPIRFGSAAITPVRTGHGDEPHFSYLLEWDGLRLYFTGDTDGAAELSRQGPLDALFISPWLLSESRKAGKLPKAARVFVYHHQATEKVADCSGACTVARQGEIYEIRGEGGAR